MAIVRIGAVTVYTARPRGHRHSRGASVGAAAEQRPAGRSDLGGEESPPAAPERSDRGSEGNPQS